jgi:hypothetical protein
MSQPVWTLSVDLQTRTATFQSGLADAAKAARGSFQEIKDGAHTMGRETGVSMTEARHGVMLLGEEFGVHLPRALTSFISSLGPVGAAMEAAFPFLAIIVGATLLLEHLAKVRAEGEKLTESQANFGTTVFKVLGGLNDKLLEAGIRADELNKNHLGALNKQLQLIDHQSLNELVQAFDTVTKAADVTFAQLKTSWYQWGTGSAGAVASLQKFKTEYDSLLAQGKDRDATALLDAKIQREEQILSLQKQAQNAQARPDQGQRGDYGKFEEAKLGLQKLGVGFTEKEVQAQDTLVGALRAQVEVQEKVAALKAAQDKNVTAVAHDAIAGDDDRVLREQAASRKAEMDESEKLWEENYRRAVSALQESEREKIEATDKGSSARLAAIDAAIKEENSKGLQETGFYKTLLQDRVNMARQMTEEQSKLKADADRQEAEHTLKMGQLQIAADKENFQLRMSGKRVSDQQRTTEDLQVANKEYQLQKTALDQEIAALDKHAHDYQNKLKQLQNTELQMTRAHENQVTAITNRAAEERNARVLSAYRRSDDEIARSLSSVVTRQESAAKMMVSLGDTIAEGMMQTAIKSVLANDYTKESDAAAAARRAFLAGEKTVPGVPGVILGATMAAMAFASVMAFEGGGMVPGVESGDVVPARLTPGETVLPKQMSEKLSKATDPDASRPHMHVHPVFSPHIHAMDAEGVDRVLTKHANTFHRHFTNTVRKMNRG